MFCVVANPRPCTLLTSIIILQDFVPSFGYDNDSSCSRRTRSLSSISDATFILMDNHRRISLDSVVVFEELPARWNFPMIGEAVTYWFDASCYCEALGMLTIFTILTLFALFSFHLDKFITFY